MARSVEVLPGTTEVSGHIIKVTPVRHPDLEVKASPKLKPRGLF